MRRNITVEGTMRIRTQLIGAGTDADPFRANLPTYQIVSIDYAAGTCIVDVPSADIPVDADGNSIVRVAMANGRDVWTALTPGERSLWHRHLDTRYREHAGEYKPEVR